MFYQGQADIYVWNGHNYALAIVERLGLLEAGGMIRVGPVHYDTLDEIARFGEVLKRLFPRNKKTSFSTGLLSIFVFLPLNDEHQGEGGTLVCVDVYITTLPVTFQELLHKIFIRNASGGNRTHI